MNKTTGAVCLISGTSIGAGMLALPLISGLAGFYTAIAILILIWGVMTYTGLLILEVNLSLPLRNNSFSSMARSTAGPFAGVLTWISVLLLLYSLTGAYISGANSLLSLILIHLFGHPLPNWIASTLFTLVFGYIVWHGTQLIDQVNRIFLSLKGLILILSIALLLPNIHLHYLLADPHSTKTLWLIAPIFLTSFGYHTVIPSLTNYIGKDPQALKKAIIIGTIIPLIIYLLWLLSTLGTIPEYGQYSFDILGHHNNIAELTQFLIKLSHNDWLSFFIMLFTNIAMVTSFLGVSLGLFDFIADVTHAKDTKRGRWRSACITFLPPLFFSILYPNGFLIALSIAAIFVAFLEVILPAWMAWKCRQHATTLHYQVAGGKVGLICIIVSGLILITINLYKWV